MDGFTLRKRAPTSRSHRLEATRPYPARHPLLPPIQRSSNEHVVHDGPFHIPDDNGENQCLDSYKVMIRPTPQRRPSKSRRERLEATHPYPVRRPHLPQHQRQVPANLIPRADEEEERRLQHVIQLLIIVLMLHAIASVFMIIVLLHLPG